MLPCLTCTCPLGPPRAAVEVKPVPPDPRPPRGHPAEKGARDKKTCIILYYKSICQIQRTTESHVNAKKATP